MKDSNRKESRALSDPRGIQSTLGQEATPYGCVLHWGSLRHWHSVTDEVHYSWTTLRMLSVYTNPPSQISSLTLVLPFLGPGGGEGRLYKTHSWVPVHIYRIKSSTYETSATEGWKAAGKIQGLSHRVLCGSELGAAPQALPWNQQGSESKMLGQNLIKGNCLKCNESEIKELAVLLFSARQVS